VNEGTTLRTNMGVFRIYAIRNGVQWAAANPKQVTDHFNRFFGPSTKKHN
jgi:hypothetical protein